MKPERCEECGRSLNRQRRCRVRSDVFPDIIRTVCKWCLETFDLEELPHDAHDGGNAR